MKDFFRHIIISLTLLVFLFSISGFTIYRHECFKSGIVHVSMAKVSDCCEKKEETKKPKCCSKKEEHKEKKKCCSDSKFSKQLKTDFSSSTQKTLVNHVVVIPSSCKGVFSTEEELQNIISYTDPSPPLSGRSILLKKQSFLI